MTIANLPFCAQPLPAGANKLKLSCIALALAALLGACSAPPPATSVPATAAPEPTQIQNQTTGEQPMPTAPSNFQWPKPPAMTIDPKKSYTASFQTEAGEIVIQLFADKAPVTVNNFVFLARQGFYDGTTFHRVIPGFMAQGGDRTGSGSGGPGYRFQDEFNNGLAFDRAGLLAMANAGPGTNGSQFFITYGATPHLTDKHTIFGEVTSGLDNALAIRTRDPGSDKNPGVVLQTVTITEQ